MYMFPCVFRTCLESVSLFSDVLDIQRAWYRARVYGTDSGHSYNTVTKSTHAACTGEKTHYLLETSDVASGPLPQSQYY